MQAAMSVLGSGTDITVPLINVRFTSKALPPKADIETQSRNVRFVPIADIAWGIVPPFPSRSSRLSSADLDIYFAASGGGGSSGRAIVSGSQLFCITDFVNSGSR